jgi:hypothetical protein
MKKLPLSIAIATLAAASSQANAASVSDIDISVNGFASIMLTTTGDSNEKYAVDKDENRNDVNVTEDISFLHESRAGVQFTVDLNDGLKFITQFVSDGRKDYNTEAEWMYLNYQINDEMQINLGRIILPLFSFSDFKRVGYAYHWSRLPQLVYSPQAPASFEGVNFQYNTWLGDVESNLQLTSTLSKVHGISWTLGYEWLSARASVVKIDLEDGPEQIIAGAQQITDGTVAAAEPGIRAGVTAGITAGVIAALPPGTPTSVIDEQVALALDANLDAAVAAQLAPIYALNNEVAQELDSGEDLIFSNLALKADFGNYFAILEAINTRWSEGYLQTDADVYYISGGYRWDKYTAHATFSQRDSDLSSDGQSFVNRANANPLTQSFTALMPASSEQEELSVGIRYEFNPRTAYKFEIINRSDELDSTNDSTLYVTGIDLVF